MNYYQPLEYVHEATMDDIPYSRIYVIYMLHPCAIGFALRNIRDIF